MSAIFLDLLRGLQMTVTLAAIASVLAFLVGTLIAVMRISPVGVFRGTGMTYVEIVRNTPLTVVFFFTVFVAPNLGVKASFFQFAVFALTAYTCCLFSESVRSGLNSVPKGQSEAARALGMRTSQVLVSIVLPQAVRAMVPPLANAVVVVVKGSSVAGVFGVAELINRTNNLTGIEGDKVLQILMLAALLYVVVNIPIGILSGFVEKRLRQVAR